MLVRDSASKLCWGDPKESQRFSLWPNAPTLSLPPFPPSLDSIPRQEHARERERERERAPTIHVWHMKPSIDP